MLCTMAYDENILLNTDMWKCYPLKLFHFPGTFQGLVLLFHVGLYDVKLQALLE